MTGRRIRLLLAAAGGALVLGLLPLTSSSAATPAAPRTGPIVAVNASQSNNWSGYDLGSETPGRGAFHSITGTWVVPTASPHKDRESEFSSSWIGIGGGCVNADCSKTDSTLIQAGTEQDVHYDPIGGSAPEYSAWYELIPNASVTVPLEVHAGDRMTVDIHETAIGSQHWSVSIRDVTTHQSFAVEVDYQSTYATAEWIVEAPTVVALGVPPTLGFAPIPDLSPVHFTALTANGRGAGLRGDDEVLLVDLFGSATATPSAPNATKSGFDDCTYAATCRTR